MTLLAKEKPRRQAHGAAMLLVLIAVAMCTILALSFLAAQQPTAVVASNIDRKTQARAIAESALKMAIDYVNEDANWRTDKTSGTWMTDIALDGGTFTLMGTDEDDGDLADDKTEAVLLTVVATYAGVTHRVSARVTPGQEASSSNRLLLVAGNGSNPSNSDQYKRDLFETWGYVVTIIDDSDSQATYDAAVAVNDVVFVSEEVNSGSVNTKLRDVSIGVVTDEAYLHDDFGFASSNSSAGSTSSNIDIANNNHPITAGFSTGSLAFYSGSLDIRHITSTLASGVTVLADRSGSGTNAIFLAADVGDAMRYGAAAGRRVIFPSTNDLNVNNLTTDGQTLLQRSIAWAAGDASDDGPTPTLLALYTFEEQPVSDPSLVGHWPLNEPAATGGGSIYLSRTLSLANGAIIDAYDSSVSAYGGANAQLNVELLVNATGGGDVEIDDATIYGNVRVGSGANPGSVVALSNGGAITGSTTAQGSNITIPTYDAPAGFGGHTGNQTYNGGAHVWATNQHFNKLTIKSGAQIVVVGDIEVRISNTFDLRDGDIVLAPGASLTIWSGHDVTIENGSTINNDTTRPGDFTLIIYGNNRQFTLEDGIVVGGIHGARDVTIENGSAIYGNVVVEEDLIIDDGAIHADLATSLPGNAEPVELTTFEDLSDNANTGTVSDSTAGLSGVLGTAFEFDGVDDYLVVPHDAAYLLDRGSVGLHFYPESLSGEQGLFSKDSSGNDNGGHLHLYTDGTRLKARIQTTSDDPYGTSSTVELESSSGALSTATWHHALVTWGDGQFRLYLDGVLVDAADHLGGLGTTSGGSGNDEPIVIGGSTTASGDQSATPISDLFTGRIDDVRIYDMPLDNGQATNLATGANPGSRTAPGYVIPDTSGYDTPLDLVIYDTSAINWLASGGLQFTGDTLATSQTYATKLHDAIEANQAFAVEIIMQRATPASTASPSRIVSYSDGPTAHNFMVGQDAGRYEARVRDSATSSNGTLSPEFVSSSTLASSGDIHLILSYQDGAASVYIDGVLDESSTSGGTLDNWDADHFLVLAGAYTGGSHWQGVLKRVAIYDNAFNAIQAQNVFNGDDPGTGESGVGTGSVQWDELD